MLRNRIELLTTGRQIRTIPKDEIPGLLGELEVLKARLWVRLTEVEESKPIVVLPKTSKQRNLIGSNNGRTIQHEDVPGPEGRILRIEEVMRMTGLARSTLYLMERGGTFPRHRQIGIRSVGWLDIEVHEWIRGRIAHGEGP